jgi:hypothetical protein
VGLYDYHAQPAEIDVAHLARGGGIGVECCGFGASIARNFTGGDFQSNGVAGT